MPWFRLDDKFHGNPKVMAAGNAAIGLYARCGTYCADHLTDGFVAQAVAHSYGTKREIAALLVVQHGATHGLWTEVDGGYQIPDYLDYNPSREEVMAEQDRNHAAKVAAGKLGGIASGVARRKHNRSKDEANGKQNEAPTRPDPSHREPVVDNSTPENTPAAGDISDRLTRIAAQYGLMAVRIARLKGITVTNEESYAGKAQRRISVDRELPRTADLFPTAPDDVIAAALHGEKHSLNSYPRSDELATVHQLHEEKTA